MSQPDDSHHTGGQGEWLNTHMGGLIMPFGARIEAVFERTMFLFVNNIFLRLGKLYVFVLAPLILIELAMRIAAS